MANSKSNIYPIQLQGAELNLNKYDAEIKQYSGFNKNNSPFVGGCLSNIFTKDETITGANGENVYIDDNGDIYQVTSEGLFKNGELLFSLQSTNSNRKNFISKIELSKDTSILKFISDVVYIKEVINGQIKKIVLVSKNDVVDLTDNMTFTSEIDYSLFKQKCISTTNVNNFYVCYVYDYRNMVQKIISGNSTTGVIINTFSRTLSINSISITSSFAICIDTTTNQYSFIHDNYIDFYTFSNNSLTLLINDASPNFTSTSGKGYASLNSYIFTSYPFNCGTLHKFSLTGTGGATINSYNPVVRLLIPYYDNGVHFRGETVFDQTCGKIDTIYGEDNLAKGTITTLFNVRDIQFLINKTTASSEYTKSFCIHYCNTYYYTNGFNFREENSYSRAQYVLGDVSHYAESPYSWIGYLFNNNQLSGFCGNYCLFEGWNNITEPETVTIEYSSHNRPGAVYYKINGVFYKLNKNATPSLKFCNGQIIINCDAPINCYDIQRRKNLLFAPKFNMNLYINQTTTYPKTDLPDAEYSLTNVSNNIQIGAAVNEYQLEDNASLLLNPVSYYDVRGTDLVKADFMNIRINNTINPTIITQNVDLYYRPLNSDKALLYVDTINSKKNINLLNLPFPVDANGNVTYSPNLFSEIKSLYGNDAFIKNGNTFYPLIIGNNTLPVMSFYLASGIDNFEEGFIIQGQFYGIINNGIYSVAYNNGVVAGITFIVNVENLQYVGSTPYEALFFSKTNRCLYSFTGANVLNQKQLVDKISEVRNYLYNPATQTVFLITDIGVLFYGLFGMFLLEYTNITNIFLLDNGIVMSDNSGNYRYIKYYLDEGDEGYTKENIRLETCFYGMNNEVVTINDCLYFRLFSEEHEEGNLKVKATTISLKGRQTEETTFKIKASDWDAITHTIYLRYQPKTQRGLGVSFSIDSPFKIASMSVGSQPDAVLVDRVSKGAITAPSVTTNNNEW